MSFDHPSAHLRTAQRVRLLATTIIALNSAMAIAGQPDVPPAQETGSMPSEPPPQELTTPTEFRKLHPEPKGMDDVLALYRRVQKAYLAAARMGVTSRVVLHAADGQVFRGHDDERFDGVGSVHEQRDNYELIAVGQHACQRKAGVAAWNCWNATVDYGLGDIDTAAVYSAATTEVACGPESCYRIAIGHTQPQSIGDDKVWYSEHPELYGWDSTLLVRRSDSLPVRLEMVSRDGPGREFRLERDYDYDVHFAPIELPARK